MDDAAPPEPDGSGASRLVAVALGAALGLAVAVGDRAPAPEAAAQLWVQVRHDLDGRVALDAALAPPAAAQRTAGPAGCVRTAAPESAPMGAALVAQLGPAGELAAARDAASGRYRAVSPAPVDDLRWQPISVWTTGEGSLGLSAHRALRMPDPVAPLRVEAGPLGGMAVLVPPAPPQAHLALEVALPGGGHLRCPARAGLAVLPPGTPAALGAPVWLATVRRAVERVGGTAVVGEAIGRVPLAGTIGPARRQLARGPLLGGLPRPHASAGAGLGGGRLRR